MHIYFLILALVVISVFLFVLEVYRFGYEHYFYSYNIDENINIGTLGDFIGGLTNPALSFLSFIALLFTIFISIKTQRIQSFDTTFNTLIEQHNRILSNLKVESPGNNFQSIIKKSINSIKEAPSINEARSYLINKDFDCDSYLRLVYQILNLVVNKYPRILNIKVSKDQKRYSNILRAILDQETLFLIAINAASTKQTPSFDSYKILIEKTNFLEHLKPLDEFQPLLSELADIYNACAFGESIYKNEIFRLIKHKRISHINKSERIKKHLKVILNQIYSIIRLIKTQG